MIPLMSPALAQLIIGTLLWHPAHLNTFAVGLFLDLPTGPLGSRAHGPSQDSRTPRASTPARPSRLRLRCTQFSRQQALVRVLPVLCGAAASTRWATLRWLLSRRPSSRSVPDFKGTPAPGSKIFAA
ncbi:hypothetical protein CMUS01_01504 [Colletotrichum musicola]|uniref:Uncharacterized protein n=1 Tax=Colletotrichum musicola TaxID=2175873 RepID=A0A8H6U8M4_9PEZI|nr:hypothetical protein CMUS01_01504 [Colletotrichum musicola]